MISITTRCLCVFVSVCLVNVCLFNPFSPLLPQLDVLSKFNNLVWLVIIFIAAKVLRLLCLALLHFDWRHRQERPLVIKALFLYYLVGCMRTQVRAQLCRDFSFQCWEQLSEKLVLFLLFQKKMCSLSFSSFPPDFSGLNARPSCFPASTSWSAVTPSAHAPAAATP